MSHALQWELAVKTVGIIGGIGPESTIEYYRLILAGYRQRRPDGSAARVVINSVDLKNLLDLVSAKQMAALTDYLAGEVHKLAAAGADFGLLASNTPHIVFNELRRRATIPLLSIVEATCVAAKAQGLRKLGLFGTRFTMMGGFYPEVFSREGITVVAPEPLEQDYIHEKYLGELVNGIIKPETRNELLGIARGMKKRDGIEAVILGGTELPLILPPESASDIPLLDTTRIHANAALDWMFQ
ncbi:MAG TPA: amino acid racemase [Candidatus Angelobacter sp.]|nr:amino acid racemase [Candidatus Angelobacter sp.]